MACKYKYKDNWYSEEEVLNLLRKENSSFTTLYNNLLKELETSETGRKVFEQVKRDYVIKNQFEIDEQKRKEDLQDKNNPQYKVVRKYIHPISYTLEEQQEEAIVQIIGLYSAQKLDKLKDKTLIQLIKELLKEMSDFVKLIFKKEINIAKDLDNISELTDTELNKLLKNGEITKKC